MGTPSHVFRLAPDFRAFDQRRMTQLELDRDQFLAFTRELGDMSSSWIEMEMLATRGDRLCLLRIRGVLEGGEVGPSELEHLDLIELDEHGGVAALVRFDTDSLGAAYTELDARYAAGESADPGAAWQQSFRAALDRRDWDALVDLYAPAIVADDHRLVSFGTPSGPAALLEAVRAMVELAPDVQTRTDHVRTSSRGLIGASRWIGTRDGGPFEIPLLFVVELDTRAAALRLDIYDPQHLDRAIAQRRRLGLDGLAPLPALQVVGQRLRRRVAPRRALGDAFHDDRLEVGGDLRVELPHERMLGLEHLHHEVADWRVRVRVGKQDRV